MLIRQALPSDCESVARVQINSNRTTYRGIMPDAYLDGLCYVEKTVEWKYRLQNQKEQETLYVVDTDEFGIVGFFLVSEVKTNEISERELLSVYILEEHQKKGIGKYIFKEISKKYKDDNVHSIMLWTLKDNPSRGFYERLGGQLAGTRTIERGRAELMQVAYKWEDIADMGK